MSIEDYLPTMASPPPKKRVHYDEEVSYTAKKARTSTSSTNSQSNSTNSKKDDWAAAFHVYFREQVLEAQRIGTLQKGLGDNGKPTPEFERLGRTIGKQWRRMGRAQKKVYQLQAQQEADAKTAAAPIHNNNNNNPSLHPPAAYPPMVGQPIMAPPPGVPFPYQPPPFLPVIPPPTAAVKNTTAQVPPPLHYHPALTQLAAQHPPSVLPQPQTAHQQTAHQQTATTTNTQQTSASSSTNNKKPRQKKKRILKKPTKPLSAYKIFSTLEKEKLLEDTEDGFVEDLTLCIHERWKALSHEDQAFYEAQAERDARRYRVKLHEYHKALRQEHEREQVQKLLQQIEEDGAKNKESISLPDHDSALGAAEVLAGLSKMSTAARTNVPTPAQTFVPILPQQQQQQQQHANHPTTNGEGISSVVTPPPPPVMKQDNFMATTGTVPPAGTVAPIPATMMHNLPLAPPHRHHVANSASLQHYRPYSSIVGGGNTGAPLHHAPVLPLLPTIKKKEQALPTDPAQLRPYSSLMRLGAKMPARRKASNV